MTTDTLENSDADAAADLFQSHRDELGFVNRAQCRDGDLITMKSEGETVGALLGNHCIRKPQSTVYELAVSSSHRRKGIGAELVERFANESPHEKLVAKCPAPLPANEFYAATGWERIDVEDGKKRELNVWQYAVSKTPDKITTGRPDLTAIAAQYGWLRGSRVDYLDRYETRGYRVDFIDPGPDNCDADDLIAAARRHHPRYVVAGDYDDNNYSEINALADRLRDYARSVIVVPHEPGEVERVPEWCVVGYSTPSAYAGTTAPVWEYRGRDVHVLGGTIEQSLDVQGYLGDDVVSWDCNSFHGSATQYAIWWGGSSPHWNRLPRTTATPENCTRAYENTLLNVSYYLAQTHSDEVEKGSNDVSRTHNDSGPDGSECGREDDAQRGLGSFTDGGNRDD